MGWHVQSQLFYSDDSNQKICLKFQPVICMDLVKLVWTQN